MQLRGRTRGSTPLKQRAAGPRRTHRTPLLFLLPGPFSGRRRTARVAAASAGRVGGVCCAPAARASGSWGGSGAWLWGGRGPTDRPRRDGGCGCSARVLRVGERLRDHQWREPLRLLLEMLFLSVSCFSVFAGLLLALGHAPGRRKEPGHDGRCGLDRAGQRGTDQLRCRPPPSGHVDPRLRSMFQFHAGSWESWCCCCLIPADTPGDRGRRWRLEMADTRSVHETRFEAAVKVIQSLPKNGTCTGSPLQKPLAEA